MCEENIFLNINKPQTALWNHSLEIKYIFIFKFLIVPYSLGLLPSGSSMPHLGKPQRPAGDTHSYYKLQNDRALRGEVVSRTHRWATAPFQGQITEPESLEHCCPRQTDYRYWSGLPSS